MARAPPHAAKTPGTTTYRDADPAGPPAPFTPAFWEQVNQGPLEEAYEERLKDRTNWTPLPWWALVVGSLIGVLFAYVNIFAVLGVGFAVGGSFYLSYFIGTLARWRPGIINYVGGASTGASQLVLGLAYVVPALFLLSQSPPDGSAPLIPRGDIPSPIEFAAIGVVGGLFGLLFFQFYRRLWIVDRPLPYPGGFPPVMELLSLVEGRADRRNSLASLAWLSIGAALAAGTVLLRDLTVIERATAGGDVERVSVFDALFGGPGYASGFVPAPATYEPLYLGLFSLQPLFIGIGWFIRLRIAGILALGALGSQLLMYVAPGEQGAVDLFLLWRDNARTLGAGAIVGAGTLGLIRLRHVIIAGARGLFARGHGEQAALADRIHLVPRSWFVVGFPVGAVVGVAALLVAGFGVVSSLIVLVVGTLLVAFLGLVGARVTGETSVQPLSPLTLVAMLTFAVLFNGLGFTASQVAIMALVGAAFFATGLIANMDFLLDVKVAHYLGNPPRRQALAQLSGLVPGLIVGALAVTFLSRGIVDGTVTNLTAPIASVYSGLLEAVTGGDFWWTGFLVAAGIGAAVELATGLGTVFGIGMVLPAAFPFTILGGALLREGYERATGPDRPSSMAVSIAFPSGLIIGDAIGTVALFGLLQLLP